MGKLHQVVAVIPGLKSKYDSYITERHHIHAKGTLFDGLNRSYRPFTDGDEVLPDEHKRVNTTVAQSIEELGPVFNQLLDAVREQDDANCVAKSDIVVDGVTVAKNVPVTHMLFLHKRLTDLRTFIEKIPVLDSAIEWKEDTTTKLYRSGTIRKVRTKKVNKPIVLYDATEHHPAQTQLITEDIGVGEWAEQRVSGAASEVDKKRWLHNVDKVLMAVTTAREEANRIETQPQREGEAIFNFIFGK